MSLQTLVQIRQIRMITKLFVTFVGLAGVSTRFFVKNVHADSVYTQGYNDLYRSLVRERELGRGRQVGQKLGVIRAQTIAPQQKLATEAQNEALREALSKKAKPSDRQSTWKKFNQSQGNKRGIASASNESNHGLEGGFGNAQVNSPSYYRSRSSDSSDSGPDVDTSNFPSEVDFGHPKAKPVYPKKPTGRR